MGSGGVALSVVAEMEKYKLQSIAKHYDINMQQRQLPDDEEIEKVVAERITALLEAKLRARDNIQLERMRRFAPLARHLAQSEEGLSLMIMLLDDYYQQTLHALPEQPPAEAEPEIRPKPRDNYPDKPQDKSKSRRPRSRSKKERTL
jgi:ATP-dependent RNA helicase DeaD